VHLERIQTEAPDQTSVSLGDPTGVQPPERPTPLPQRSQSVLDPRLPGKGTGPKFREASCVPLFSWTDQEAEVRARHAGNATSVGNDEPEPLPRGYLTP
jgi:hypothetical protein